jgi:dipeptidyl aminopeptidase/acylaminoacyl peptidase
MAFRCLAVCFAMLGIAGSASAGPAPVAAFFSNPRMTSPSLSPSGQRAAALAAQGDRQILVVRDAGQPRWTPLVQLEDPAVRFTWTDWESERTVLVAAELRNPDAVGVRGRATRLFSVDTTSKRIRWLGERWPFADAMQGYVQVQFQDQILHWTARNDGQVLIAVRDPLDAEPSVRRMNVTTGKLKPELPLKRDVHLWWADPTGAIRAGEGFARGRYVLWARANAEAELEKIQDSDRHAETGFSFAAFGTDPAQLLVYASKGGRRAVATYDLAARALGDFVFADPTYDAEAVELDPATRRPRSIVYLAERPERHFLDDAARAEHGALEQAVGGWVEVTDSSEDGRVSLVRASSERRAPAWYLFDRERRAVDALFLEHPHLEGAPLGEWRAVRYPARDGTEIPAYLTLPPGSEGKKLPAVVLVHGGPTSRVVRAWDPEVQYLATRGFAVFQPNFRGSSGYGDAFRTAGYRQWGLAMQDDVTDGARWLMRQGIADPDRVGIYGSSYGGYAALMGAVKTPNLYRAAASYAGVTSIPMILSDAQWYLFWEDENRPKIGDGWDDAARLARTSPLENAARIDVPVLLGHGADDPIVHVRHSQRMAAALRGAGAPVEYLEFPAEVHGFVLEANRQRWYEALADFFERNLAPRTPAP